MKSHYICESCEGCSHRKKCYKGKYENRKVEFSKTMAQQKAKATKRITTEEGILLRVNRSIQVEGAFGVLKQDRDFRRFFVRSKVKTETQIFLLAFAFNIKKLWNRTFDKGLGLELFERRLRKSAKSFNIKQKESGKLHPLICCALLQSLFSIIHSRQKAAAKSFDLRQPR